MAPHVLHPRMASILFFLTTSFALPLAMQVLAQEQAETLERIQSPNDLDPATRRRYERAAREAQGGGPALGEAPCTR